MKRQFITAFPGRRDSYQVPLALHEHGRLAGFLTDGYDTGWVARALRFCGSQRLDRRRCPGLPPASVRPGFDLEMGARVLGRLMAPSRGAVIADEWLARRAAAAANARGASALLYEFQAELGFRLLDSPRQRRILFQFHPHPAWEHPLLRYEAMAHPEFAPQVLSNLRTGLPARFSEHTCQAWREADHVIVASSCTRTSLLHAGCPASRITIVPYGREAIEPETPLVEPPPVERPFFLWVGAGSIRKGLHHLCEAWARAGCATTADLVVVARVVEPGLERLLAKAGIRWIPGLSRAELRWHYRQAHAFVLPSLSEGFGQVYLEALANGCRVIGTRHSVLPDVTDAQRWIDYVRPADIDALAGCLQAALHRPPLAGADRAAVAASVRAYTWDRFRAGVEAVLHRFD